jgi:hypothetical protein
VILKLINTENQKKWLKLIFFKNCTWPVSYKLHDFEIFFNTKIAFETMFEGPFFFKSIKAISKAISKQSQSTDILKRIACNLGHWPKLSPQGRLRQVSTFHPTVLPTAQFFLSLLYIDLSPLFGRTPGTWHLDPVLIQVPSGQGRGIDRRLKEVPHPTPPPTPHDTDTAVGFGSFQNGNFPTLEISGNLWKLSNPNFGGFGKFPFS